MRIRAAECIETKVLIGLLVFLRILCEQKPASNAA
jgi:hypothetical protein